METQSTVAKRGWGGAREGTGPKPQGEQPKSKLTATIDTDLLTFARAEAQRLGFLHRGEPNLSAYTEHLYREARDAQQTKEER